MAYNSFPYVNMHELNLDYLLNKSKEVQANVEASAGSASAAASSAAAAAGSADAALTYSRNSANSAAAAEASAADSAESARIAVAAAGDPKTFTAASQLTDTSKIYVYIGETGTYTYGHWYYYAGGAWIDGGVYGTWATDDELSDSSANAVQNRVITAAVNSLKSDIEANTKSLTYVEELEDIPLTMVSQSGVYIPEKIIRNDYGAAFTLSNPVTVVEGEVYRINAEGYGSVAAYAFGNNGTIISVFPSQVVDTTVPYYVQDKEIIIPTGVNELYVENVSSGEVTVPYVKKVVENKAVKYISQTLSAEEKKTARANIDTISTVNFEDIAEKTYSNIDITVVSGKLIASNGEVRDAASNYKISDNISVLPGNEIKVTCSTNYSNVACAFYNSNDELVQIALRAASGSAATVFENRTVEVPAGASYMLLATLGTNAMLAGVFTEYALKKIYRNLKWTAIGDSLTEINSRATINYLGYISEETGINVHNMGVSGTGYKRQEDSNKAFYQRALNIPVDSDVVTIFGSGNDQTYYGSETLGTATDTGTATLGGCINTTIDNIYSVIPTVQLGIIAPCPWGGYNPANHDNGMAKYTELLKEICENRSIPFLDLYHCSNLRPWDVSFRQYAYSHDDGNGTHPDETGHKLLASRIRVFLDSLIGTF